MISTRMVPAAASVIVFGSVLLFVSCANNPKLSIPPSREVSASKTTRSSGTLVKSVGVTPRIIQNFIPPGSLNRRSPEKMNPKYITIHSTANQSATATADAHVRLLHRAGRGKLSWHFTVDESSIHQTLPTDERGEHADYDGPGNRYSIGIEMCENKGGSLEKTMDRTARLTAYLMKKHNIPLSRVVPHQHWRRVREDGKDFGHKNCPHFLMDDGAPGKKWQAFLAKIQCYR